MNTKFSDQRYSAGRSKLLPYLISQQLFRYVLTGGSAALFEIAAFMLLLQMGVTIVIAAIWSFAGAAVINYLLSSRFVFVSKRNGREFFVFLAAAMFGLAVNVGVTTLSVAHFGVAPLIAKVIGIGAAFLVNFVVNRTVVFGQDGP